jgi:hypothetical protein
MGDSAMKITWELWSIVRHPPQHPVFERTMQQSGLALTVGMKRALAGLLLLGIVALLFVSLPLLLVLLIYGIVLLPVVLLFFNGIFYGLYRAVDIGVTLAQEYQRGTFDLLRVTPPGGATMEWLISAGCLHRGNWLVQINRVVRSFVRSVPLALLFIGIFVMLSFTTARDAERWALSLHMLEIVSGLLAFCGVCYLDHVQSTLTGCLAGIVAAQTTRSTIEVRVWAALLFLVLQIGAYVLIFFMTSMAVTLVRGIGGMTPLTILLGAALIFGLYYLVREAIIGALWRLTLHQTHTTVAEWSAQ